MKREKTIESVEQFDEELTSKYTMMESDEQVLTALFSEVMNASSQGNQVSSIYYDAEFFHSSDIYSAIAASQAEATGVKKEQTSQEVESAVEENENPFIESVNSFKEIGSDFWSGFQERGDKKMDSLYDFGNYLTSGLFDGVRGAVNAMDERSDKAMDSPYDFVNYLTNGGADLVKGAVNPEDDFSKEHWLSSFGLASIVTGAKVSVPKSGTAKTNSIKHTVHPDVTRKFMKETYQKVVQGQLINSRMYMKDIVRKVLDYKVPWRTKYSFAGVGDVSDLAVREMLNNAKETLHFNGKRVGSTNGVVEDAEHIGRLKGKEVLLKNIVEKEITYTKRNREEFKQLRNKFNSSVRKNFLQDLVRDEKKLKQLSEAGLTNSGINKLQNGLVPDGYQVHHKLPLDDGGNNDFSNLILIENDPHHKVLTNSQKNLTKGMKVGDSIIIKWPLPEGIVYPTTKK